MREHRYKAKRIDNGEWVEGFLVICPDGDTPLIFTGHYEHIALSAHPEDLGYIEWPHYQVIPATVCQFTGRENIFDRDIIIGVTGIGKIGSPLFPRESLPKLVVDISDEHCCTYAIPCDFDECEAYDERYGTKLSQGLMLNDFVDIEVIGNVHDGESVHDKEEG